MIAAATTSLLAFNGPVVSRPTRTMGASMAVEDLVGGINDPIFGGTPEGKIFDPLGLGADEASLYRRRCVEIKHGRVCMVAFLGMTVGPNDVRASRRCTRRRRHTCGRRLTAQQAANREHESARQRRKIKRKKTKAQFQKGVLAAIEQLQEHEDEAVYKEAARLLEDYLGAGADEADD